MLSTQRAGEATVIIEAVFPWCTAATKLSILLLYQRIFTTRNRAFKWALWTTGAATVSWAIANFFTVIFQCNPVRQQWERTVPGGWCIQWIAALIAFAVMNTALNFVILILPTPLIWRLQMRLRRKVAVFVILALGCGYVQWQGASG